MKKRLAKFLSGTVFMIFAIFFTAKFSLPSILRFYVQSGIGSCQNIPIFCMIPTETVNISHLDSAYTAELLPYKVYKISAFLPHGFDVVQELIMKTNYKKYKRMFKGNMIYILCEDKDFFIRLYPQVKKEGVANNYDFIRRIMRAKENEINNVMGAFFVIMKGVFIPDLGNQFTAKMIEADFCGFKGFINYNLDKEENYFDCNIINQAGVFFKVYIKDKNKALNLEKVFAILSTLRAVN